MGFLFETPIATKLPKNACTAGPIGSGPVGETCGTCLHLVRVHHHDGRYLKCGLMAKYWTHGAGSDIRAKWAACREWEPGNDSR